MSPQQSPSQIQVWITGTPCLVCESLALLLDHTTDSTVIGQVIPVDKLFQADCPLQLCPDLILVDVDTSNGIDLSLTEAIKQQFPAVPTLVLITCTRPDLLQQLMQLDIQACLSKEVGGNELVTTIKLLKNGGGGRKSCLPPSFTRWPRRTPPYLLTSLLPVKC